MISITHIPLQLWVFFFLFISAVTGDDDTSCLTGLKGSLDEGAAGKKLSQWTTPMLVTPCETAISSKLDGIICSNSRVVSIILNFADLSGTLSPSVANCSNLQTLDLSSNSISGTLPTNIGNLSNLVSLNLSSNVISGPIPTELSACLYLNYLDLHRNRLTGTIPGQLGLLGRLKILDVSYNKLSGQIPTSLSNTSTGGPRFNASSFEGNKDLFGYPLPEPSSHSLSVLAIVGIGLGSGLLSLIVSSLAVCVWLRVSEQGYAAQEGKISHLVSDL